MTLQPKDAFKQPLQKTFYGLLLKLEQKVYSNKSTENEVGTLAEMYGQIVSYYDTIGDPVKYYFLEKIQVVITRHTYTILNKKEKTSSKKKQRSDKLIRSLSESSESDVSQSDEPIEDIIELLDTITTLPDKVLNEQQLEDERNRGASISKQKKTRQKKMGLLIQLKQAQKEEPNQYQELQKDYEESVTQNDLNIKQLLQEQSDALKLRIENRKINKSKSSQSKSQSVANLETIVTSEFNLDKPHLEDV